MHEEKFKHWITEYSGFTLWFSLITFIIIQILIFVSPSSFSRRPINYFLYFLNLTVIAFFLSYISIRLHEKFDLNIHLVHHLLYIFVAVGISLLLHTIFAKNELTFQSASLYILGAVFITTIQYEIFDHDLSQIAIIILALIATIHAFLVVW